MSFNLNHPVYFVHGLSGKKTWGVRVIWNVKMIKKIMTTFIGKEEIIFIYLLPNWQNILKNIC